MHIKQHTTLTHSHSYMQSHTIYLSIAPSDNDALNGFRLGPFSNSVRQLSFSVSIVNDMIPENDEDFTARLTLLPADQARLRNRVTVQPGLATVTILDDEGMIAVYKCYWVEAERAPHTQVHIDKFAVEFVCIIYLSLCHVVSHFWLLFACSCIIC